MIGLISIMLSVLLLQFTNHEIVTYFKLEFQDSLSMNSLDKDILSEAIISRRS
jgi:hypothetical protein